MDKMVLDYTFLKSLLMIDDPKHDLAESMISTFNDRTTCYIPFHIFLNVMQLCSSYNNTVKEEVFHTLTNTCRIQNLNYKQLLNHYPNILHSNDLLNFNDWLTIEYMKEKNIKVLLSFNEKFDNVKGINRVYDFDEYNKNILNFFKYSK